MTAVRIIAALLFVLIVFVWAADLADRAELVGVSVDPREDVESIPAPTTTSTTTTTFVQPKHVRVVPAPVARSAPKRQDAPTGDVPAAIRAGFARFGAEVAEEAVRVAGCETGHTYNPAVVNSSGHTGLFQLSPRYHTARAQRLGFSWAQMRQAGPNVAVAADLYAEQGWGPWTCRTAA